MGSPADDAMRIISSGVRPTRATPSIMPIVAGTPISYVNNSREMHGAILPPFTRTIDSSSDASATLAGYGNPEEA